MDLAQVYRYSNSSGQDELFFRLCLLEIRSPSNFYEIQNSVQVS